MRRAQLLIVAALAIGGVCPALAASSAPVTLPLKLGTYETPKCGQTYDGVDEPFELSKKGYFDDGDTGNVTFVAVASMGQNRYRIRTLSYDETGRGHYFSEVWQVLDAKSFTVVSASWDSSFQPTTYRYCGSK